MVSVKTEALQLDASLQAADILLVHTKRSLWGWLVRSGTRCYWNHALMVYSPGKGKENNNDSLAVDAKTNGTIAIRRVNEYLGKPGKYDIAVKRLKADWFYDSGHTSHLDFRGHVCNIAVNEVDFKLGSRLMEQTDQFIRQLTVIFRFIRRKLRKACTPPNLPWNIRPVQVKAFTCGGFVQWCYYKGVSKAVEERGVAQARLKEVIFNPHVKKEPTPFELLTTTPADIANCDKLSWKYVVKSGVVYQVSSNEDVRLITLSA